MRCVVHIGTEKTGTTSIQESLDKNSQALISNGVLYPPVLSGGGHPKIACYAMDYDTKDRRKRRFGLHDKEATDHFRKAFEAQFQSSLNDSIDTVLIVNEHLSRLEKTSEVERLKDFLSRYFDDVHIVVYLRRQDKLMRSMYSTRVKLGFSRDEVYPSGKIYHSRYNYKRILDLWSGVWGRNNITARVFEQDLLVDGDALSDFLQAANVEMPDGFESVRANESLSPQALVVIREMNKYLPGGWRYRGNIGRISAQRFPGGGMPVSKEDSLDFLSHFCETNRYVAKAYFGRDELFKPIDDREFNSQNRMGDVSLTVDGMARVFAGLWAEASAERFKADLHINRKLANNVKLLNEREKLVNKMKIISERANYAQMHPWRNLLSFYRRKTTNRLRRRSKKH